MKKTLVMSVLAALLASGAQAQEVLTDPSAAPAPAAVTIPPAPTPTGPALPPAVKGLSPETQTLVNLQRELAIEKAQVAVLEARAQRQELDKAVSGASAGTTGLPQLVGLLSGKDGMVAEFVQGISILQVRTGEWVSAEWRLTRVLPNGVELTSRNGRAKHTLLLGGGSTSGSASFAAPAVSTVPPGLR